MNRIIILAIIVMTANVLHAQKQINFGIKAGVNDNTFLLQIMGTGSNDVKYRAPGTGGHVGVMADIKFTENLSVQPQLIYVSKGGSIELNDGGGVSKSTFRFNTIDLPINLLYHHQRFFIGGGPNFSYGVKGTGTGTGAPSLDLYNKDEIGIEFKRFEIGANVMMGYEFPGAFLVTVNYAPALSDIVKDPKGSVGTLKSNNSYAGVSIGYMFNRTRTK